MGHGNERGTKRGPRGMVGSSASATEKSRKVRTERYHSM